MYINLQARLVLESNCPFRLIYGLENADPVHLVLDAYSSGVNGAAEIVFVTEIQQHGEELLMRPTHVPRRSVAGGAEIAVHAATSAVRPAIGRKRLSSNREPIRLRRT